MVPSEARVPLEREGVRLSACDSDMPGCPSRGGPRATRTCRGPTPGMSDSRKRGRPRLRLGHHTERGVRTPPHAAGRRVQGAGSPPGSRCRGPHACPSRKQGCVRRVRARTLGGRPAPIAWPGVSMAERSVPGPGPGCGDRRVERAPAAITGGVARRWRREACGAGGGVRRSGSGARPAALVRGERDLNHYAQGGCALSWLVRDERPLPAGGASCHGVCGERPGLDAASNTGEAGEAA
jgi:hypothetical protein